jgi:hypothetical protein
MTRAKFVFSIVLPLYILPQQAAAQTAETLAAADRLIAVQDLDAAMADMASKLAVTIPGASEAQKRAFVVEMTAPAFLQRYKERTRSAFAKNLTAGELNALSDFYSKPIAKSAMQKMGATTAELMPFIQAEIPAIIARVSNTP